MSAPKFSQFARNDIIGMKEFTFCKIRKKIRKVTSSGAQPDDYWMKGLLLVLTVSI